MDLQNWCSLARLGRDLPEVFGKWDTVYRRFRRWVATGVFDSIFDEIGDELHMLSATRSRAEKPWMGREISAVKPGRTESGTTAVRAGQRRKWP